VYASTDWGTSSTNPAYPFAVPYPSSGTFDASASDLKGVANTTQGLLPLTSDTAFVEWNPASTTMSKTGGSASSALGTYSCSGTSTLTCTVWFGCTTLDLAIFGLELCVPNTINVDVKAFAKNVGMAFRTYNNGYAVSGFVAQPTHVAPYSPLQADGSARINFQGQLNYTGWCIRNVLTCQSRTITTDNVSSIFPNHAFLAPAQTDNWYWFIANNWHHVTYYALAPLHAPGAAGNCSGTTCISVTVQGDTSLSDKRAVLALAGRSLSYTSSSSRTLADFLDSTENRNQDLKFEQYKSGRSFNDRFVSLSP
jgi:hypothetical protein